MTRILFSDWSRGAAAWSEPETANMRDWLTARGGKVKFYNSVHSYGQVSCDWWADGQLVLQKVASEGS